MNIIILLTVLLVNINPSLSEHESNKSPQKYYALMLRREFVTESGTYIYRQPTQMNKIVENEYSFAMNEREQQVYICPPDNEQDENLVTSLTKIRRIYEKCLFVKEFHNGVEKTCEKKPEPVIMRFRSDGKYLHCSPEIPFDFTKGLENDDSLNIHLPRNRYLFSSQYVNCGSPETVTEVLKKPEEEWPNSLIPDYKDILLYLICFDTNVKQTIYTIHKIFSATLFHNRNLDEMSKYDSDELQINPFEVADMPFEELRNAYAEAEKAKYKMIPFLLVPKEHMVFGNYKRATLHYINVGPLWETLVPLMNVIDNRIKFLATKAKTELHIFTIVFFHQLSNVETLYLSTDREKKKIENIWCKIVYYPTLRKTFAAVAIIVHNTPGFPPSEEQKVCDEPRNCDIKKWFDSKHEVSDELLRYAYCCKVTAQVLRFYPLKLNIDTFFNMDEPRPSPVQTVQSKDKNLAIPTSSNKTDESKPLPQKVEESSKNKKEHSSVSDSSEESENPELLSF